MNLFSRQSLVLVSLLIFCVLIVAACNLTVAPAALLTTPTPTTFANLGDVQPAMVLSAPILRATLNTLLGEHVFLAANATGAALQGGAAEFAAATAALDNNSQDLAAAIGLVYGKTAEEAFLALWRTHIGFFVEYTTATANMDAAAQRQARADLSAYAADFGAFLAATNPNLTQTTVQDLLGPHVNTLTAVIDAQASADYPAAHLRLRAAYRHMDMIAARLAGAISQQFPARFPGAADSMGANLRATLNQLLAEHVALAAMTTGAALAGRAAEMAAAAAALDNNSIDLANAVGAVYGGETGDAFLGLWRKHIAFFGDYATAARASDEPARTQVLAHLTAYTADLGAFLAAANPNLTPAALQSLLGPHVSTLTAVIDAQAADLPTEAYRQWRAAYAHMRMIANPLSDAIIIQFPASFRDPIVDGRLAPGDGAVAYSLAVTPTVTGVATLPVSDSLALLPTPPITVAMSASTPITENQVITATVSISEPAPPQDTTILAAPRLRATLDRLLGEHVGLVASASDAALRGRMAEYNAAARALANNSADLAGAIGLVYGQTAQDAFLPLWTQHIGLLVDYTTAAAANDEAARVQALNALDAYAEDFGAFLQSANPNLPKDAVAALLRTHVATLVSVIDAQAVQTIHASGDQIKAYPALRTAFAHMDREAAVLAAGLAQQFPTKFPGAADTPAADLRAALTQLLAEHAWLLIKTMDAATHARNIEYEAAFAALNENSVALAEAVGSLYGAEAGAAFLGLWRKHIGLFTDYTLGLIDNNSNAQQKAAGELTEYAQDFAAFLNAANPALPVEGVVGLLTEHTQTSLVAIDASAADQPQAYYTALHAAYSHMGLIADGLSDAIIAQFPDRFGTEMTTESADRAMATMLTSVEKVATVAPPASTTFTVAIATFSFQPPRLEIPVGSKVVWTNEDAIDHTVTSGKPGAETGLLDSGFFNQDEQFSVTFGAAGEYPYFCQRHNAMQGVIVVK